MKKHADINVHGLVQGVSFRFSARVVAETFGVVGFAENRSDGCVHIAAEGETDKLEKFISWCHRGPEDARVDKVEFVLSDDIKNFSTFESIKGMQPHDGRKAHDY